MNGTQRNHAIALIGALVALVIAISGALVATTTDVASAAPRHHRAKQAAKREAAPDALPVILVHGAGAGPGCFGYDTDHYWAGMTATLDAMGWHGPVQRALYYCGDSGEPGSIDLRNGAAYDFTTPIEVIAYHLAWWIYLNDSVNGQAVDLVGHSMGGLIMRYALYRAGGNGWPPYLLVHQAITLSTPHGGIPNMDASVCQRYVECMEMEPHSEFLDNLQRHANPPQGRGGTSWTEVGGGACDVVPASSALSMRGADTITFSGTAPTCYTHGSYLEDLHVGDDVPYAYRHDGISFVGLGPTPDRWIVRQLRR